MRRRLALLAVPLVVAFPVALAACGGEDDEAGGGGEALQTIELTASEFEFDPSDVTLDEAGTYKFVLTNDGEAPHALEIEGNGLEDETDTIDGGESAELEVTLEEGEY